MAERRMFAKSIVLSDAFLDMPMSARCLYFTLGMLADDEGFIGSPKSIMRQCGSSQDDMLALIQKRYILDCGDGVIVIKHWRMNNYLQKDRFKETTYVKEKELLTIDKNGAYTEKNKACIQDVYTGKDSIGKYSIDNNISIPQVADAENSQTEAKSNIYERIISYLNEKSGKHFRIGNEVKVKIDARINSGATEEDFYKVIDNKCSQWLNDPKMNEYLRPITLFGNKFDSYLNAMPENKIEDKLPTYDATKNKTLSKEEEEEILRLMNKNGS